MSHTCRVLPHCQKPLRPQRTLRSILTSTAAGARRGLLLAVIAWAVLTVSAPACQPQRPRFPFGSWRPTHAATADIAQLEAELIQRINEDRAAAGLPPLQPDPRLADIARAHSADMRDNGFFGHESPATGWLEDRADWAGYLALELRENLAQAATVQRAEDNLLSSPGHQENILAPTVTHIGVGIVRGDGAGDARNLTITQVFARPTASDTPEQVIQKLAATIRQARQQAGLPPLERHPQLDRLTAAHIAELPADLPHGSVARIGSTVGRELTAAGGYGLGGIQLGAELLFNGDGYEVPEMALEPTTIAVGLAAARATDSRGRPRVKVLILFGSK